MIRYSLFLFAFCEVCKAFVCLIQLIDGREWDNHFGLAAIMEFRLPDFCLLFTWKLFLFLMGICYLKSNLMWVLLNKFRSVLVVVSPLWPTVFHVWSRRSDSYYLWYAWILTSWVTLFIIVVDLSVVVNLGLTCLLYLLC